MDLIEQRERVADIQRIRAKSRENARALVMRAKEGLRPDGAIRPTPDVPDLTTADDPTSPIGV